MDNVYTWYKNHRQQLHVHHQHRNQDKTQTTIFLVRILPWPIGQSKCEMGRESEGGSAAKGQVGIEPVVNAGALKPLVTGRPLY